MALLVYECGPLEKPHENRQMKALVDTLNDEFKDIKSTWAIIIDVALRSSYGWAQIDAVVWMNNRFFALDLKNISGKRVIPDCTRYEAKWHLDDGNKVVPIEFDSGKNPFFQVRNQRYILSEFLTDELLVHEKNGEYDHDKLFADVRSQVAGWVVLNKVDLVEEPVGLEYFEKYWFRVCTVSNIHGQLRLERARVKLFNEGHFKRFLALVNAEDATEKWIRKDQDDREGRSIVVIDGLLSSSTSDDICKGLNYVRELRLFHYLPKVLSSFESRKPSVRKLALQIILEWGNNQLSSVIRKALLGNDEVLQSLAFTHLKQKSVPGTFDALDKILNSDDKRLYVDAIIAQSRTNDPKSCTSILKRLSRFGDKPFAEFKQVATAYNHYKLAYDERATYKEIEERKEHYQRITKGYDEQTHLFDVAIKALGELECKDAVPLMLGIVLSPKSIGLDEQDGDSWLLLKTGYDQLFEASIKSLESIGDGQVVPKLLQTLDYLSSDYKHGVIKTLGNLGDRTAIPSIASFLKDEYLQDIVVYSLGRLRASEYFEEILSLYEKESATWHSRLYEEALSEIDRDKFESYLIGKISSTRNDARFSTYIMALSEVASEQSIKPLLDLLHDEDETWSAAGILYKFSTHPDVIKITDEILRSGEGQVKASALSMREDYFKANPDKLRSFATDSSPAVRGIVAYIYSAIGKKVELLRFADDQDRYVRLHVHRGFVKDTARFPWYYIATTNGFSDKCELGIAQECIFALTYASQDILIIPTKDVLKIVPMQENSRQIGFYFTFKQSRQVMNAILLPESSQYYNEQLEENSYRSDELLRKYLGSKFDSNAISDGDRKTIDHLLRSLERVSGEEN